MGGEMSESPGDIQQALDQLEGLDETVGGTGGGGQESWSGGSESGNLDLGSAPGDVSGEFGEFAEGGDDGSPLSGGEGESAGSDPGQSLDAPGTQDDGGSSEADATFGPDGETSGPDSGLDSHEIVDGNGGEFGSNGEAGMDMGGAPPSASGLAEEGGNDVGAPIDGGQATIEESPVGGEELIPEEPLQEEAPGAEEQPAADEPPAAEEPPAEAPPEDQQIDQPAAEEPPVAVEPPEADQPPVAEGQLADEQPLTGETDTFPPVEEGPAAEEPLAAKQPFDEGEPPAVEEQSAPEVQPADQTEPPTEGEQETSATPPEGNAESPSDQEVPLPTGPDGKVAPGVAASELGRLSNQDQAISDLVAVQGGQLDPSTLDGQRLADYERINDLNGNVEGGLAKAMSDRYENLAKINDAYEQDKAQILTDESADRDEQRFWGTLALTSYAGQVTNKLFAAAGNPLAIAADATAEKLTPLMEGTQSLSTGLGPGTLGQGGLQELSPSGLGDGAPSGGEPGVGTPGAVGGDFGQGTGNLFTDTGKIGQSLSDVPKAFEDVSETYRTNNGGNISGSETVVGEDSRGKAISGTAKGINSLMSISTAEGKDAKIQAGLDGVNELSRAGQEYLNYRQYSDGPLSPKLGAARDALNIVELGGRYTKTQTTTGREQAVAQGELLTTFGNTIGRVGSGVPGFETRMRDIGKGVGDAHVAGFEARTAASRGDATQAFGYTLEQAGNYGIAGSQLLSGQLKYSATKVSEAVVISGKAVRVADDVFVKSYEEQANLRQMNSTTEANMQARLREAFILKQKFLLMQQQAMGTGLP
ncbi:MAG: hypothetical protein ABL866_10670 [Devosia sp.]